MGFKMALGLPYLTMEKTRSGAVFYRIRKGSTRAVVYGEPFSEEFNANYRSLLAGGPAPFEKADCAKKVVFHLNAPIRKVSHMLGGARGRASDKGLPFDLSEKWIVNTFNNQEGLCAVSGLRMTFDAVDGRRPVSYTHLRAHETRSNLVCRLLLEKKCCH